MEGGMRRFLCFFSIFQMMISAPVSATTWKVGDEVATLRSEGSKREFLLGTNNVPLFIGEIRDGKYLGKLFKGEGECPKAEIDAEGIVNETAREVVFTGPAPVWDKSCVVAGYKTQRIVVSFKSCGKTGSCEMCGTEPELKGVYGDNRGLKNAGSSSGVPRSDEQRQASADFRFPWDPEIPVVAKSCPYLYGWNEKAENWERYGKVITDARGHVTTDIVRVKPGTLRFRLSEEEPEESFFQELFLRIETKNGLLLTLMPSLEGASLISNEDTILNIKPFRSTQISFELPSYVEVADIKFEYFYMKGYYERVPIVSDASGGASVGQ
jgi:hypothetical protein